MKLKTFKDFATRHKDALITTATIAVFTAIALDSSDALALKEDAMKESVKYMESILRGNAARIMVVVGLLAGAVISFAKANFTPMAISLGTSVAYGGANLWIDSAYTALI